MKAGQRAVVAICVVGATLLTACADRGRAPAEVVRGQAVEPAAPTVGIPRVSVSSTPLNSVGYDKSRKILAIRVPATAAFTEYYDVPPAIHEGLMTAPISKGRYLCINTSEDAGYKYARA